MDAIMSSANSNANFKEATEKLMYEFNNSTYGHCFHPPLSLGHTNLHFQFCQSLRNKIFELWKMRDKAKVKPKKPIPVITPKPKIT